MKKGQDKNGFAENLHGKVALVTDPSRGVGKGVALGLTGGKEYGFVDIDGKSPRALTVEDV